jgi:hypothetical protein
MLIEGALTLTLRGNVGCRRLKWWKAQGLSTLGQTFSEGTEIDAAVYLNDLAADLIIYEPSDKPMGDIGALAEK